MVKVRVRLYRGHDYDLLPLSEIYGAAFASIAKNALEALFLGKEFEINITDLHYVPTKPVKKELVNGEAREKVKPIVYLVRLSDKDCPGIESWFRGFVCGHRNNLVKLAIRRALGSFPMEAYRSDGWMSAEQESKEVKAILANIEKEKEESANEESEMQKKTVAGKKKSENHADNIPIPVSVTTASKQSEALPVQKKEENIESKSTHLEQAKKNITEQPSVTISYAKPVSYEQEYMEEDDVSDENTEDDENEFDVLGAFESLHA